MKHIKNFESINENKKISDFPADIWPIFIIFKDGSGIEISFGKTYSYEDPSFEKYVNRMYNGQTILEYDKELFDEISSWLERKIEKIYYNDEVWIKGERICLEDIKYIFNEIIYLQVLDKYNL
jgi:hypothetical protein